MAKAKTKSVSNLDEGKFGECLEEVCRQLPIRSHSLVRDFALLYKILPLD
jgi:hypothetical protein